MNNKNAPHVIPTNKSNNSKKAMTLAMTFVCMIIGIVIAVQFNTMASIESIIDTKTLEELRIQLLHEINSKASMEEEILNLNEKIKILEEKSLSEQGELLKEEYRKAQMLAGLNNVNGPGLVITIGENANMLLSVDKLLQLINDLRMADAQAISINDERIVAMSEISKGDYFIVVNGNTVVAPYIIKAIGPQDKMETMVNVPLGVISQLQMADWIVKVERMNDIQIPKIKDGNKSISTDLIKDGAG